MSIVALPILFGSKRFGKVVGGILDSDGKAYPQPGGAEIWQPGMTVLVAPPGTDASVEAYGFKTDAMLSGGNQQLYGKDIFGWIFCDSLNNKRWLIQPDLAGATAAFAGGLSITFDVVQFGLFDGNGPLPFTEQTRTLANWGQTTPAITEYGDCTHDPESGELHLVSAKTDGSVAVIQVSIRTDHPYNEMPWLHHWPIGYIGVTCTAVADSEPSLALSVLRDRAATVGTRTNMTVTGSLTTGTLCDGDCAYEEGLENFNQGVNDAIVALFYDNNTLTAITADCEIVGSNLVEEPYEDGSFWEQDSTGTVSVSWSLTCNARSVSWAYVLTDTVHARIDCSGGTKTSEWTTSRTESFNGREVTSTTSTSSLSCRLEHTDASTGTFIFQVSTGCRSSGDLWEDHYAFSSEYHNWGFWRYAHNVVGLYCEIDGDPVRGSALTPAAIIPAASVGTGYYGAFNARTGEGVAGVSNPVGYV